MSWSFKPERVDTPAQQEKLRNRAFRIMRGAATLFYVGPNDQRVVSLARRTEGLPFSICYFWSAEQLNAAPFLEFELGLIVESEWRQIQERVNQSVLRMLSQTPFYILGDGKHGEASPYQILGALKPDVSMINVVAEVVARLEAFGKQP